MFSTFRTVFSASFQICKKEWKHILVGMLTLALILGVTQYQLARKTQYMLGRAIDTMGIDQQRVVELTTRIDAGDIDAMEELEAEKAKVMLELEGMTEQQRQTYLLDKTSMMYKGILPLWISSIALNLLGLLVGATYFMLISLSKKKKIGELAVETLSHFLPMLGVAIWACIRGFFWVPFLNIITGVIFGPRLVFAGVLHLTKGTGPLQSSAQSNAMTKGKWVMLFPQLFSLCVLTALFLIIVTEITLAVEDQFEWFAFSLHLLSVQFVIAFNSIFVVELSKKLKK